MTSSSSMLPPIRIDPHSLRMLPSFRSHTGFSGEIRYPARARKSFRGDVTATVGFTNFGSTGIRSPSDLITHPMTVLSSILRRSSKAATVTVMISPVPSALGMTRDGTYFMSTLYSAGVQPASMNRHSAGPNIFKRTPMSFFRPSQISLPLMSVPPMVVSQQPAVISLFLQAVQKCPDARPPMVRQARCEHRSCFDELSMTRACRRVSLSASPYFSRLLKNARMQGP